MSKDLLEESAYLLHQVEEIPTNSQSQDVINKGLYAVLYGILAYLAKQEESSQVGTEDFYEE